MFKTREHCIMRNIISLGAINLLIFIAITNGELTQHRVYSGLQNIKYIIALRELC